MRLALEARRTLGEDHPDLAPVLSNLAGLYASMGRSEEALSLLRQAESIADRVIGQLCSLGSDRQRMAILTRHRGTLDAFLSLVVTQLPGSPEAVGAAFDLVLRRKALGAEASAAQRNAVLVGKYPNLRDQLRECFALRGRIARKFLAGPGPEGPEAHQRQLALWDAQKEQLEADLARQIPEMNLELTLRAADRHAVALSLHEGATLVEFARFQVFDFQAVPAHGEPTWKPARYLAVVLAAGEPNGVRMIDLGEAGVIDDMIAQFRADLLGREEGGTGRGMVIRHRSTPPPATPDAVGTGLRVVLVDPLVLAIGDRTRLLLAPDGSLSRLPFEVLPTPEGDLLIDRYAISYLGCGRDVLRFGAASTGRPTTALVAADPDFDLGGDRLTGPAPLEKGLGHRSRSLSGLKFPVPRLPATRVEGGRIALRLRVRPWMDAAVLEAQLKAHCRSPRILHLATHGFFLEDQEHVTDGGISGLVGLGEPGDDSGLLGVDLPENPLLRAGLILAGANTWHATGHGHPDAEDGLLTAEDVSGMDLLATELVVLSACETGLGEARSGEGVFGLQRAFVLAGAKTLVMSLWAVPDMPTAILMDRYYANLLDHRLGRAEALREAQHYVRSLTVGSIRADWLFPSMVSQLAAGHAAAEADLHTLTLQPADHRPFAHPYYWGAFVCLGDAAPLPTCDDDGCIAEEAGPCQSISCLKR